MAEFDIQTRWSTTLMDGETVKLFGSRLSINNRRKKRGVNSVTCTRLTQVVAVSSVSCFNARLA